jgi:alkyl hydroperoxide reductase subunit AhpC
MKLPNWFRILWWFLLTAGLTWVLYRRYPDLVAGHAAAVDVFVFAVWVALILVPLFHEVSFSGVKFWRKYDTSLRINSDAPNFTAETTQGTINFHQWIGDDWAILFSHPKDFTPVCTTELGDMARLKPEFDKRDCKIIGMSVDPVSQHGRWSKDIEETQGYAVNYPMIGDPELKVAKLYDMLPAEAGDTSDGRLEADNATVRSVFIIGPDKKIKATLTYPMSSGRNFDEVLRLLDSCQLTAKHRVATPVNWKPGDNVIIAPSVSDEQARQQYPGGWQAPRPYLRIVPQPR